MPRASLVEKRARALCVELTRVTANTPMEYWMVRLIARLVATDYKTADAAIAHAVAQGWLLTEGEPPQSICLADDNRWRQFETVWPRRLTSSAMSSETETLALHLVRALHGTACRSNGACWRSWTRRP